MKILILGQRGMLGHVVFKYFKELGFNIEIIEEKFPSRNFCEKIINSNCDFLINCIGSIPQKTNLEGDMMVSNFFLPVFLSENFQGKIIHATTDCEFSGATEVAYSKNSYKDALDIYGKSKILASDYLKNKEKSYVIRTSIIGFENGSQYSLLNWFLNNKNNKLNGFVDHWWNGITTLQWAKICHKIINQEINDHFIQVGTQYISKFDLLNIFNDIFKCDRIIIKKNTGNLIFKCLESDFELANIKDQIIELKNWYK